jgi:hypothetical protein
MEKCQNVSWDAFVKIAAFDQYYFHQPLFFRRQLRKLLSKAKKAAIFEKDSH